MTIIGYKYHGITKQLTMSEHRIKLSKLNVCNGGSSHATVHTCDYCLEGETFEKQNWHKYAVICIRIYASSWNKGLLFFYGVGGLAEF